MISEKITRYVITIGCYYKNPRGGIAQVINLYSKNYEQFYFISSVKDGNKIYKLFVLLKAILRLCYWFLTKDIKVVHIHGCSNISFHRKKIFIFVSKFFNKKIIFHIHGGGFQSFCTKYGKDKVIRILNKCDVIVALSQSWKEFFTKELKQTRVVVVDNIIPVPNCFPKQKNTEILNLVFLGLIDKNKGIFDLVELLAEYYDEYKGKIILHIGGNGNTAKLTQMTFGIADIVKYHGWVDECEKQQLLSNADIYILPSYHEGLPISILEAMSYKLPVISTNVGGIPEIIEDKNNGFLITPGDKIAMKIAIDQLLTDKKLRKDMGQKSFVIASKHYPLEVEKQLISLYKELL